MKHSIFVTTLTAGALLMSPLYAAEDTASDPPSQYRHGYQYELAGQQGEGSTMQMREQHRERLEQQLMSGEEGHARVQEQKQLNNMERLQQVESAATSAGASHRIMRTQRNSGGAGHAGGGRR
jgi:DNA polymerase III delta prime subunit